VRSSRWKSGPSKGQRPLGSECCVAAGDSGDEAYTAIAWGVGLGRERSDIAEAESFHSLEGNICGARVTILRAIKSGHITGTKDQFSEWRVEPVELHAFIPQSPNARRHSRHGSNGLSARQLRAGRHGVFESALPQRRRQKVVAATEHARKQVETLTEQATQLAALAQKVTLATAEPLKTGVGPRRLS
jgi:hypothetical protein